MPPAPGYTRTVAASEKAFVRDLVAGNLVDTTLAVLRKERRRTRDGRPFLALELADRSGRIRANVFEDVAILDGRFAEGDAIRVLGTVEEYRNRPNIVVRDLQRVEVADPLLLVPGARRDLEDLDGFLDFLGGEITDAVLGPLVVALLADEHFRARFRVAPVTLDGHHAYAGGAIEHAVGVASVTREVAQLHPLLDAQLLAAASLVFVSGAADAFEPGATLRLSDAGSLLGVASLSARRVERVAERLRTPDSRLLPLLAAIAPVRPRSREAGIVQAAIALDAAAVAP